jgi:hypothetical protein
MNEIRTDAAELEKKMFSNLKNHPDYYQEFKENME